MSSEQDNPYCTGELAQKAAAHPRSDAVEGQREASVAATHPPCPGSPTPTGHTDPAQAPPADDTQEAEPQTHADALAEENRALREQLLRLAADYDNAKKRQIREREQTQRFADERVLADVLPIIDNLERALAHSPSQTPAAADNDPVVAGVRMVLKQFQDMLAGRQVTAIVSVGTPFDPQRHEALGQEVSREAAPGTILHEVQKGYTFHDRLLRPARVIVAAAAPDAAAH